MESKHTRNNVRSNRTRIFSRTTLFAWIILLVVGVFQPLRVWAASDEFLASSGGSSQEKISGEIFAHHQEKLQEAVSSPSRDIKLFSAEKPEPDIAAETCALYVERPFTATEAAELRQQGISVGDVYIPPVPDSHPFGFYLATIDYTSLPAIQKDPRIVRLESVEFCSTLTNDKAKEQTNVDEVHRGSHSIKTTGKGVRIAILDTEADISHPDIPTPLEIYDVTDGPTIEDWGRNVDNPYYPHGTHVIGSALGRGTRSNGQYKGAAPEADLCFYKVFTGGVAYDADIIKAINRARALDCDILSMSLTQVSPFMDGSGALCQAVDAAVADGVACFVAAGNEGNSGRHYAVDIPPNGAANIKLRIHNKSTSTFNASEHIRLMWIDDNPYDWNISLRTSSSVWLTSAFSGTSLRGTEARRYVMDSKVYASESKEYTLVLKNNANTGWTPKVHIYLVSSPENDVEINLVPSDRGYTVGCPAIADKAIAVGAWTQRRSWTDYEGNGWEYADLTVNTLAPFSGVGPRIDGLQKPDLVAPGAATISVRPSCVGLNDSEYAPFIVDNDSILGGRADYYVAQGTSMASPYVAGIAALVLERSPALTPEQLRNVLTSTASQAWSPDNHSGYGLVDAYKAVSP